MSLDSFQSKANLTVEGKDYEIFQLDKAVSEQRLAQLPFSIKILLENQLRFEDGDTVKKDDIQAALNWDPRAKPSTEIAYRPARVLLQDFTGVPSVVDFGAMREAMQSLGGRPDQINPLSPAELVIDHSVMVDYYGSSEALKKNAQKEFERNEERYKFLRWGQNAFDNFKVVPPDTGIVHQVNLEYLARVTFGVENKGPVPQAYPDTLVGTDSHTTMINGLGVLGWGVGGIEAEAAMLGQPITMLLPEVVGFKLEGKLPEGATATDLVLTVTEMLRQHGVVGKFVEFFGDGLDNLPLADRATIANMAPEYGATCGIFPVDEETLKYMRLTGRSEDEIALTRAYSKAQGLFRETGERHADYSSVLELDMGQVVPSLAGPKRPQDRIALDQAKPAFEQALKNDKPNASDSDGVSVTYKGETFNLKNGAVVIAAITSCTNTSNPAVLMAAGLMAQNAVERGLKAQPWVKTSLAPGSQVVTDYLKKSNLLGSLEQLGFHVVGYGCTTCIGNSGPLPEEVEEGIQKGDLVVSSVLSGNRNFEGRIHGAVRTNYLASPPLVVAYALAGTMNIDLYNEAIGEDADGKPVYLADIWPSAEEVQSAIQRCVDADMFSRSYEDVFKGDENWRNLDVPTGTLFQWDDQSTYVRRPPFFDGIGMQPDPVTDIQGARALALLGDSITTDHISPAGAIKADSPAGQYLQAHGIEPKDFNSYGSRRGNHEVMMRGTFANVRLKNQLVPGVEGGYTEYFPSGEQTSIYDAAMRYQQDGTPLVVIAGKEYGTGSSRDWAAKGTRLLGVKAVIAESYERIHRSNLVGMGVLPLQFKDGESAETLGLTGRESFSITGLGDGSVGEVQVEAESEGGQPLRFSARVRLDTPKEVEYYQHGGILQYVLRELAQQS